MELVLSPFSREAESNAHETKADDHVPCANARNREASLADVENYDPEEADKEVSDHNWRQPAWALDWAL